MSNNESTQPHKFTINLMADHEYEVDIESDEVVITICRGELVDQDIVAVAKFPGVVQCLFDQDLVAQFTPGPERGASITSGAFDPWLVAWGEVDDDSVSYRVCSDCLVWIANADDSGLDNLPPDEAQAARQNRDAGLKSITGHLVPGDEEYGFCHDRCEICHGLAGDRYEVVELQV